MPPQDVIDQWRRDFDALGEAKVRVEVGPDTMSGWEEGKKIRAKWWLAELDVQRAASQRRSILFSNILAFVALLISVVALYRSQ